MKIIVDADSCPKKALEICKEVTAHNKIDLFTVANFNHNIESDNHIVADSDSQSSDIIIVNLVKKNDIVVTQDLGLAALVLGKKASVISPGGEIVDPRNIDYLLEIRGAKSKMRRNGKRIRNKIRKRDRKDDFVFKKNLNLLIDRFR